MIAGDLENEEIRTHIEMEGSAWLYAGEDPNRMATIYDVMELATAVKPFLLKTLLARGGGARPGRPGSRAPG